MRPLRFSINVTLDGCYDRSGVIKKASLKDLNDIKAAVEHE